MDTYSRALNYFSELSTIPRQSWSEEWSRNWIIKWAENKWWKSHIDDCGNLLVIAPGNKEDILCLQSHLDMVCVSKWYHDFINQGIAIIEENGKLTAKNTSLGADNGIGVSTMMALAELTDRPTLELLFTVEEEIGCVGAAGISLSLNSKEAINLDWSDSSTIGVGCGGTLLLTGSRELSVFPTEIAEWCFILSLHGMQGWHSWEDIRHYRGNAIIELLTLIKNNSWITHINDIIGWEADNAIPHRCVVTISYNGHPNLLKNELGHIQKLLRIKYKQESITIEVQEKNTITKLYKKEDILRALEEIVERWTGVQKWWEKNTPLSSWNLWKISLKNSELNTTYFLRSNITWGIEEMEKEILWDVNTLWQATHRSPPWTQDVSCELVKKINTVFVNTEMWPLPTKIAHATVECGLLAQKYPEITWISVWATVHNMHTIKEYIEVKDFAEFVEKLERYISL